MTNEKAKRRAALSLMVLRMKKEGASNTEIAEKLGVRRAIVRPIEKLEN